MRDHVLRALAEGWAHNGELERGKALARELGEALPGTIVSTSGGCAAHLAGVLGPDRREEAGPVGGTGHRQVLLAERDASRRHVPPRVVHRELGEDHPSASANWSGANEAAG